jgi:hypothetical protein
MGLIWVAADGDLAKIPIAIAAGLLMGISSYIFIIRSGGW